MRSELRLPRSTPEEQGVSSKAVLAFLDAIRENDWEVHGFMLLRHGHVVAEGWWAPYRADIPHALYSLSKSIVATAIGFAAEEGLLSLDDRIVDLFPEDVPGTVSEHLSAMNIRHLLTMTTGHAEAVDFWACESGDWVKYFLATPVERVPGTHFVYNTCATYMLCAILQRVAGQPVDDFLEERLFVPLGMAKGAWERCPRGIAYGGTNLSFTTEDIAKFGQLYVQRGRWSGRQLLPESWVDEAASFQVSNGDEANNDWTHGYGYQFWRCRHNSYRADGAFGQFCLVMPEQDAVLAVFSGTEEKHALVSSVWETLLPGMAQETPAPDEAAARALVDRLNDLRIDMRPARTDSPIEPRIQGRVYAMEQNPAQIETVSLRFEDREAALAIRNPYGEQTVRLGRGCWQISGLRVSEPGEGAEMKVAGSCIWRDDDTLDIHLVFVETSFRHTLTCRFEEDRLALELAANIYWDWLPNEVVAIRGQRPRE